MRTPNAISMVSGKSSFFSGDGLVLSLHPSRSWVFPVVLGIDGNDVSVKSVDCFSVVSVNFLVGGKYVQCITRAVFGVLHGLE